MKTLGIIREILKKPASEIIYRKYAIKTTMSAKILRSPTRRANTIDFIFVGNYARSSQLFESGFTGFRGLTITSLGSLGRLLLNGAFVSSINYLYTQNKDVLCNPRNPENPDSRQDAINIV
jgi:hypothetical protein